MDFKTLRSSYLQSWLYLYPYSIISYYRANRSTPANLLQVSDHSEQDKITSSAVHLWEAQKLTPSPSFETVIKRHFSKNFAIAVLEQSVAFILMVLEGVLIYYLIKFLKSDDQEPEIGIWLVCALIINSTLAIIINAYSQDASAVIGVDIRKIVTDLVSDKLLKVHSIGLCKENIRGKFVNVISADLASFEGTVHFCRFISAIIATVLCFGLVLIYFGVWGIVGLTISVAHIPIILYTMQFTQGYRIDKSKISDKRMKLIENLIQGIKLIKLYAWEVPYLKLIFESKQKEAYFEERIINIVSIFIVFCQAGVGLALFVSLTLHSAFDNELKSSEVFFLLSIYIFTQGHAVNVTINGIKSFYSMKTSLKRVEEILLLREYNRIVTEETLPAISVRDYSSSWEEILSSNENEDSCILQSKVFQLREIQLDIHSKGLLIVIGPSGSGKTTLLMSLLGELPSKSKYCSVSGSIGFAAEDPWIIPDTLRENIIMGKDYDADFYKTVIEDCALVLDMESLPNGDNTVVGDRGVTLSGGQKARLSLARALYSNSDIYLLDDSLSAVDTEVGLHLFKTIKKLSSEKIVVLVTHQTHFITEADQVLVLDSGAQVFCGSPQDLSKTGSPFEDLGAVMSTKKAVLETDSTDINGEIGSDDYINQATVTSKTYWKYTMLGMQSIPFIILVAFMMILAQVSFFSTQYWCVLWIDSDESFSSYYVSGMAILVVVTYFFFALRVFLFNKMVVKSNEVLHNKALEGLANTDPRYFDIHSTGALIARFSKDVGYLDESMIKCYYDSAAMVTIVLVTAIIQAIILPYTTIVFPFWVLLSYYQLYKFNPVVLDMRNTELVTRGPLLGTYLAVLSGYATIRSLALSSHFLGILKEQSLRCYRASYAFQVVVNFMQYYMITSISILFAVNVIAITATKGTIDTSLAAFSLALSTLYMKLTRVFAKALLELHSFMCSAHRLIYFAELEPEGVFEINSDFKIDQGSIRFVNVCMRYGANCSLALNNLSFTIDEGKKVGIVGRTGAGKSSIMQVLFRLVNQESGSVLIDGVDHMTLGLHDLRKQLAVIPQNSFLFSASVRDNLDPFKNHTDQELMQALDEVSLYLMIEDPSSLDSLIVGKDLNLSSGQKQLLCLARAILRKNKIVMMDEATSNIDNLTDKLVQEIVRDKFKECTMLIIAHRLRTVIDCDQILVMENGACKESGTGAELFSHEGSLFRNLILSTGTEESKLLVNALKSKLYVHSENLI